LQATGRKDAGRWKSPNVLQGRTASLIPLGKIYTKREKEPIPVRGSLVKQNYFPNWREIFLLKGRKFFPSEEFKEGLNA
jgi:hypothetical protein